MVKLTNLFNNYENIIEDLSLLPKTGDNLTTDVFEENGKIIVEMDLSGIESEDIDIYAEDNQLHVTGSQEEVSEEDEENYYMTEVRYGSFDRMVTLPEDVDTEKMEASFEDGILTVEVPKAKKEKKKVTVKKKSASKNGKEKEAKKATKSNNNNKKATAKKSAKSANSNNNSTKKATKSTKSKATAKKSPKSAKSTNSTKKQ